MIQIARCSTEEVVAQIYLPLLKDHLLLEAFPHQEVPVQSRLPQHHPEVTSTFEF